MGQRGCRGPGKAHAWHARREAAPSRDLPGLGSSVTDRGHRRGSWRRQRPRRHGSGVPGVGGARPRQCMVWRPRMPERPARQGGPVRCAGQECGRPPVRLTSLIPNAGPIDSLTGAMGLLSLSAGTTRWGTTHGATTVTARAATEAQTRGATTAVGFSPRRGTARAARHPSTSIPFTAATRRRRPGGMPWRTAGQRLGLAVHAAASSSRHHEPDGNSAGVLSDWPDRSAPATDNRIMALVLTSAVPTVTGRFIWCWRFAV